MPNAVKPAKQPECFSNRNWSPHDGGGFLLAVQLIKKEHFCQGGCSYLACYQPKWKHKPFVFVCVFCTPPPQKKKNKKERRGIGVPLGFPVAPTAKWVLTTHRGQNLLTKGYQLQKRRAHFKFRHLIAVDPSARSSACSGSNGRCELLQPKVKVQRSNPPAIKNMLNRPQAQAQII